MASGPGRSLRRRVAVTGLGALGPHGTGVARLWEGIRAGVSGIGPITLFEPGPDYPVRIAGEVRDFDPLRCMDRHEARRMDRYCQFAVSAACEVMEHAALAVPPELAPRAGVAIGSGVGGVSVYEAQMRQYVEKGPHRISPFLIPSLIANMAAGQVSMRFGLKGPSLCPVSACASGAHAIGEAARWIQYGICDVVVAGGAEASITPLALGGFAAMRALSNRHAEPARASRPFDRARDGFVCAEGAGLLVLEDLDRARRRGAPLLAEVVGYASTSDAWHVTAPPPEGDGAASCMAAALADADLRPEQIDYINAHGTSTPLNDVVETRAIKRVFGPHAARVAISSSKSMIGHLLGAAGAIEAVICVKALQDGLVPPTINLEDPDPECDLDYTPNRSVKKPLRVVISNSFGFGGANVSLVFSRLDE